MWVGGQPGTGGLKGGTIGPCVESKETGPIFLP